VSTNGRAETLLQCGAEMIIPDFLGLSIEMVSSLSGR
jgi:hypothetical protein